MPQTPGELDFEQAMDELRRIVERIEAGNLSIEQSVAHYEQGRQLIEHCRKTLEQAQRRVEGPGEGRCDPLPA